MSTSIIYFSRTGKTKALSNQLAKQLDGSIYELQDNKNWKGFLGFFKAGFYASSNKSVDIAYDSSCLNSDQLIILSPVWAGGLTPAVKTFIQEIQHDHMTLVLRSAGPDINKFLESAKSKYPSIEHFFGTSQKLNDSNETIQRIVETLK